ncbi:MAG: PAS domain S-box protein [Caulobacter sp.]|nr:PAS domain S-box protein [Caulobacter sp.]
MTQPDQDLDVAALRARLARMEQLVLTQTALAEAELDLDAFMAAVVERLAALIGARGSIVELVDGEDMVYRAANAPFAHHVGARLKRAGSLSGLCVERAEVMLCEETRTDPRVDAEACERIGVRSMVCAPLFHGDSPIGALKVFSSQPDAFDADDIDALRLLAAMLGAELSRQIEFERHEALQAERRVQEKLFETAFHHAPIGMALVSLEGGLVKLNEIFCSVIGYSAEEAATLTFQEITHPDDLSADLELLGQLLAGEIQTYQLEKRYIRKDGATIWVRLSVALVHAADGSPHHFIAQIQDLSAERHAEHRYRLMAENATDIIVTSDLLGRTTFLSPASDMVTGYTAEDMMGRSPIEMIHDDDAPEVRKTFGDLLSGKAVGRVRWRARHKTTQDWIWLESQPALLRDPATDEPTGFLDVIRDVTAQKAQEDALAQARLDAEAATRSKADFLANMSHELRTPLNSIIGFSRLLTESRGLDPEDQRRIGLVHSAGQALHAVIDNVLDFSKLEAAALELHNAPFDLIALVTQTVSMMEPQAAAKDVRLRALIDADAPAKVVGDLGRLRQVLLNLLSNAVKFTAGGSVTVNLMSLNRDPVAPRVRIEVIDTGAGIALEKQEALFSRFVQAGSSISAHYGGTGLGLAISKQLINLMGGEIGVISAPGRGSTFWFELALPVSDADAATAGEVEARVLNLAGKRLLVVDDVELNRELMLALLGKYGCEVRVAHDGAEAVAALADEAFDLVLMDCQMPVMDGFAATRAIRATDAAHRDIPIVALTASGQPEHLARCEAAGMNGHLTKPLDPGALERVLTLHLGNAEAWRAAEASQDDEEQARRDLTATLGAGAVLSLLGILRGQFRACECWAETEADTIRHDAHALAGASGMMGFMRLSAACRALETTIEEGRDHREAVNLTRDLMDRAATVAARWETDLTARVARQRVA